MKESFEHDGLALGFAITHELGLSQSLIFGQIDPIVG